jgi:iron-sulfur cluster repair protein YtfE (RIC family)
MPARLLRKLDDASAKINVASEAHDAPHVLSRCEYAMRLFRDLRTQIEDSISTVEQLKGMARGLEVAQEIVGQHKAIAQQRCVEEKISKEDFAIKSDLVDAVILSLQDATKRQREELLRVAGKAEGIFAAASMALIQVRTDLDRLKAQKRGMENDVSNA